MTTPEATERTTTTMRHIVSAIVTDCGGQPANWQATVAVVLDKLGPELATLQEKLPQLFKEMKS